jgi:hypothetical protein
MESGQGAAAESAARLRGAGINQQHAFGGVRAMLFPFTHAAPVPRILRLEAGFVMTWMD